MRIILALMTVLAVPAAAQFFDASVPDASVGEGGPDRSSEENDPNGQPCLDSRSCDRGFACQNGRCLPQARSSSGCAQAPAAVLVVAGALVALRFKSARRARKAD